MTITIDLQLEIEQDLLAQAHLRGISLTEYAQEVLAREAKVPNTPPLAAPGSEARNLYQRHFRNLTVFARCKGCGMEPDSA